ncbi:MAG: hypothetical protein QUS33_03600 [Dehalococcoidia bacterium]|nr:hypothetical protein [Dehalococcoidia bacterium]
MLRRAGDYLATHRTGDLALLVIITLVATRGWLNFQIPNGHDTVADMLVAQAARHTLSIHQPFFGWASDWFLGYPLFSIHPPLVHYLIIALSFPFGWILGTKLLYLSFFVLSGVFAYCYVFELTRNRPASFAAGLAYVFLPYHVLEMGFEGHHGAFGLPYMLTPLILLSIEKLIQGPSIRRTVITGMLMAALMLTYAQVFPFLIGPFLVLYAVLRVVWERERGRAYIKNVALASMGAFCLPLLLTAFWWLPLLSEVRHSAATSFPLEEARWYSTTFLQALTLRPAFCCAPSSGYGDSGSIGLEILRMLPFALVILGIVLNCRNRFIWLFSASILIATLLAMGPDSPIKLFNLAYRCIPFFSGLRTPWRFLLFASLAHAVLIGFFVRAFATSLEHNPRTRLRASAVTAILLVLVCSIVAGSTWKETRTAFSTFKLTTDQQEAFEWLSVQNNAEYRVTDLPFQTWTHNTQGRWAINPIYWTYLHGKENVYGGIPAAATAYASDALEYLNRDLENSGAAIDEWLRLLNVKYVVLDKTDPLHDNVSLGDGFYLVWSNDSIDIYENRDLAPRLFALSIANESFVNLWSGDGIHVWSAEGEDIELALDTEHLPSVETTLKASFQFTEPQGEWLNLAVDVSTVRFNADDSLHLRFHSDIDLPDIYVSLDVLEQDGSRYGRDLNRVDGIKEGWNEIDFPISLLTLRHSTDENGRLDPDEIQALWFGPGEVSHAAKTHRFELYFTPPAVVSYDMDDSIEYTSTRPGKYEAHVSLDSPSLLVLSEAYLPNWVMRVNGETIHSQLTYQALNGFSLQPGEYDVTLEFTTSSLRTAGTAISMASILSVILLVVCLVGTKLWRGRLIQQRFPKSLDS